MMAKIKTMPEFLKSREESIWSPADTDRVLVHIASIEAVAIALFERQTRRSGVAMQRERLGSGGDWHDETDA